jgi:hypothetical protein
MKKKKKDNEPTTNIYGVKNNVFNSPSEMRNAFVRLYRILGGSKSSEYLFNGYQVEFCEDVAREEVLLNHKERKFIIKLPVPFLAKGEDMGRVQAEIRRLTLLDYHSSADDAKNRCLTSAYLTLSAEAKEKLIAPLTEGESVEE